MAALLPRLWRTRSLALVAGAALLLVAATETPVDACPFCGTPVMTLAQSVAEADVTALCKFSSAKTPSDSVAGLGSTTLEVVELLQSPGGDEYQAGSKIELDFFREGKPGDLLLMNGTVTVGMLWGAPIDFSPAALAYLKGAPGPEEDAAERLKYYVKFLEHPDPTVSDDAFGEFAMAPYDRVVAIREHLNREQLLNWVFSDQTSRTRVGLYGMMLGLCGNPDDEARLQALILEQGSEFRLGIDGVMGGYLLLTGERGLDVLEKAKLTAQEPPIPFNEIYSALSAVRFAWEYGAGNISRERILQTLRICLQHENLADLVVGDLSRWEAWEMTDELIRLYDELDPADRRTRRAIAGFCLMCSQSEPVDKTDVSPPVKSARLFLIGLAEKDPKTLEFAKRMYR